MQVFGKFQLLERIGTGGMAEIFLAKPLDASMSKLVAVKRILPKFMDDPSFHEMFRHEGAIVLKFRHHAIIAVHEMGTIDGQHYMSMEFFPGKTLGTLMKSLRDAKRTLDIDEKVLIIKNVAEALQYIHDFSDYGRPTEIIHRDISPHNILIGFDGATKLIDFGIAKATDTENTQNKTLKGKIPYMSPEQVRAEKLTKQTDIFSLGVVFWELLCGKKLFTGKTVSELTTKIEECKVPPVSQVAPDTPPEIARICHKALSKETHFRYATTTELIAELDAYLRSKPPENHQRKLGLVVQELFSNDLERLKEQLRRYEISGEGSIPPSPPLQVPTPQVPTPQVPTPQVPTPHMHPARSTTGSIPSATGRSQMTSKRVTTKRNKVEDSNFSGHFLAGLAIGVAVVMFGIAQPYLFKKKAPPIEQPSVSPRALPATAIPDSPPSPPSPPLPTPPPTPAVVSTPSPSAPAPSPQAKAIEAKPTVEVIRPQPLPPIPAPPVVRSPPPKPNPPKAVAKKPAPKKVTRKVATKATPTKAEPSKKTQPPPAPSSTPEATAPEPVAFVTILADPKTRIMVNGKFVGEEVVNDERVPAGKVTITIIAESGKTTTKVMNFKPSSRHIIEISSSEDDRTPAGVTPD